MIPGAIEVFREEILRLTGNQDGIKLLFIQSAKQVSEAHDGPTKGRCVVQDQD